jgi:Tol biopolymer transport system component
VFVIDARPGASPRRLTTTTAEESGRLAWSPDGQFIAYQLGDEVRYSAYDQARIAVIPSAGGDARTLTDGLDRPATGVAWSADRSSVRRRYDRTQISPAPMRAGTSSGDRGRRASTACRASGDALPSWRRRRPRFPRFTRLNGKPVLTTHNDARLAGVLLE